MRDRVVVPAGMRRMGVVEQEENLVQCKKKVRPDSSVLAEKEVLQVVEEVR
jgi:hypothetical protein